MNTLKRLPVSELLRLEPKLQRFSERQIEVAQTWAMHFQLAPSVLIPFIKRYLNNTAHTRCWCVPLEGTDQHPRLVLARIGNHLQYFDGKQLKVCRITPTDRVHKKKPSTSVAHQLLLRFEARWYTGGLLTSFCKSAGEVATALSVEDLGGFGRRGFDSMVSNNRYFNPRTRFYLTQIGSTLKQFCQCLDQELLFAIRSVQCPSPTLYNWLAQGDRQRRLQALKAQPVLIPLLVLVTQWPWPWDDQQQIYMNSPWDELQECRPSCSGDGSLIETQECLIGRIADAGLPLTDTLAWLLQAPRTSVRYLGQQRVFDTGSALTLISRDGPEGPWHRLLLGASLGNRRPSTKAHWKAFFATLDKIPLELRGQPVDWNRLFSGCPTDWSDPAWPHIADNLQDLNELFNNIDYCAGPIANNEAPQRVKKFIATATYPQIASLIDGFHRAMVDIRNALDATDPHTQADLLTPWASLLLFPSEGIVSPNGLQIVELTCPADLDAEHRALGHCIDTYDYSAYGGYCRLISIREHGQSLASAEIQLSAHPHDEDPPTHWHRRHLATAQLRGQNNKTPKSGSRVDRAYKWFWAKVQSGDIPVNLEWPDITGSISRYTSRNRKSLHAQACVEWVNQRLSKT
ncbi:hypothetical protein HZF02_23260 [Pseudomonas yamanorum]|nr:hypothetical protein HZF02_23260 [Pseudomonas yamanorum]